MREIRVTNMTSLFNKEMLIYSFFDIRLKSPLRVIGLFYFIILFFLIGVPILMFSWPPNVYSMAFALGIPFGGSYVMSKPIWNGKSFLSFAKTQLKFWTRSKVLYDWKAKDKNDKYMVNSQIIVSRHDDYYELYNIVKEEEELKYG